MICPRDGATLAVQYRHGIEVDICSTCNGIWLDRDELDKILEVAGGESRLDDDRAGLLDRLDSPSRSNSSSQQTSNAVEDATTDAIDAPDTGGGGIGDFFADLFDGF